MNDEQHETTTRHGVDEMGEEWAEWTCICGAGDDGLANWSDAIVRASAHRQDAS